MCCPDNNRGKPFFRRYFEAIGDQLRIGRDDGRWIGSGSTLSQVKTGKLHSFAAYVRRTLGPALERFGREARAGEDETVTALRPELLGWLADHGRDEQTQDFLKDLAGQYLKGAASLDHELIPVALKTAARDGQQELFTVFKRRLREAPTPAERRYFLEALAAFRDAELRQKTLDVALTDMIRPTEIFQILWVLWQTESGRETFFHWFISNYDRIAGRMPKDLLQYLANGVGGCSEQRIKAARGFFAQPGHDPPGIDVTLATVADSVMDCVTLRERESANVAKYLATLTEAQPAKSR